MNQFDWTFVTEEPYTRKDGARTTLWVWQRACRHCGQPFQVRAPAANLTSKAFESVHCLAHRDPKRVERSRLAAQKFAGTQHNEREKSGERAENSVHHVHHECTTVHHGAGTNRGCCTTNCTTGGHPLRGSRRGATVQPDVGRGAVRFGGQIAERAENCAESERAEICEEPWS